VRTTFQLIGNFLKSVTFFITFFSLCTFFTFAGESFSPADYFQNGVTYSYRAGTRGFGGGIVYVELHDQILTFTVTIRFLGAGTFSRTSRDEVLSSSMPHYTPSPSFFGRQLDSFLDHQGIMVSILRLRSAIEGYFDSKYTRLNLLVEFGNDSDYLSPEQRNEADYAQYIMNLRNAVEAKHKDMQTNAIPISIVAKPDATRASPSEWDIYSDPRIFAHELFHVIGSYFEGYECDGYPVNGMMQDEYMSRAVDSYMGKRSVPYLLLSDLLEMISSWGSTKSINPKPMNIEILDEWINRYSDSSICSRTSNSRVNYLSWPPSKKMNEANKNVLEWISGKYINSNYLIQ